MERFNVLTGPTGIMNIVVIFSPNRLCRQMVTHKAEPDQPDALACHIFVPGAWPARRWYKSQDAMGNVPVDE
jgi:hypothetical protein